MNYNHVNVTVGDENPSGELESNPVGKAGRMTPGALGAPDANAHCRYSGLVGLVMKGISWGPSDLTGGPVDQISMSLRSSYPDVQVERLSVTHAGDDDNVWYISRPTCNVELQLDSMPNGLPPFLLESDTVRERTDDVREAVELLTDWLRG
jgi:hypothetical protein